MRRLLAAIWGAASSLSDDSPDELDGYRLVVTLGKRLAESGNEDGTLRELMAKALLKEALVLKVLNRRGEALACYGELVRRFEGAADLVLRDLVAAAKEALQAGETGAEVSTTGTADQ